MEPSFGVASPSVLAGGAAAQLIEAALIGHLLDRVKVEQQAHLHASTRVPSATQCLRRMYARGGTGELYRGFRANLALGAVKGGTRWWLLTAASAGCSKLLPVRVREEHPCLYNAAVGAATGVLETTFVTCPLESVKVFQMTSSGRDVGSQLRRDPRMLWRGWSSVLAKQVITWAVFLGTYDRVRRAAFAAREGRLSTAEKAGVGAATGALASLLYAPADLTKTLSQTAGASRRGMLRSCRWVCSRHGPSALFSGLGPKMLRNISSATLTILTLDFFDGLPDGMKLSG
eukprot:TRINITY_DN40073_c0_g1_i1.p1 TRINITY_DN40073_c0_g1~~TRINITY_DN40073_c0_g1_i1.p1  ORF type:complete len:288 (+),score=57.92 TRINITY_DN40073_c0_g1_i1:101-964(+)